jgi:hypothetical protein
MRKLCLAFTSIKQLINDCPTMYFLLPEGELYLYTDASDYGIGGYLYQIVDAKERPVSLVNHLLLLNLNGLSFRKKPMLFCIHKQLEHLLIVHLDYLQIIKNLLYITESSNPMIYRMVDGYPAVRFYQRSLPWG